MAVFRVDLPLPMPSNNAYPTNFRTRRRYLCARARQWKTDAGWLVRAANPPKIRGAYIFRLLVPEKMRGDADGRIKLPQDLMVELGVTPDDCKAKKSSAERDPSVKWGRCVLVVESVE